MSDPVFVKTRHLYDSYSDLFRLVELSGFPTCYVDEVDASDPARCYILPTRNGESQAGWPDAKARIIHFNLEWDAYPPLDGVAETWAADKWFAESIGARYVPIGSHPGLRLSADTLLDTLYDVAFIGYLIPRRQQMQHDWRQLGLRVSPSSAWGDERHRLLSNSVVYGHTHQHDDKPGAPPLRLVVAAAYKMPFITETCADAGVFAPHIMQAPYSHLAGMTRDWLKDIPMLNGHGEDLYGLLCVEMPFRKSIERAL